MRPRTLPAVTVIALGVFWGCTGGVSRNPLGNGRGGVGAGTGSGGDWGEGGMAASAGSSGDLQGGADSAGKHGVNGGDGGVNGGDDARGGEGGVNGGEGGANGGEGGANGGEGGVNGGATGGASGGEGGVNGGATGGASGGEGGASAGAAGLTDGEAGNGGVGDGGGPVFRRCSSGKPFGAPKRSGIPNGCTRLRLNPDETVGYYGCRIPGAYEILVATRSDRNALFGEGAVVHTDPGDNGYLSPTVTADGLMLYFENDLGGSLFSNIYQSAWDPEQGAFGAIELARGLRPESATYGDYSPYVIPSGEAIYFHSARVYPWEEIYRAAWDGDSFSEPERIELQESRGYVVVSPDELTLYYTSNPSGGSLTADIWQVTRTTASESFASIEPTLVQGPNEGEHNDIASFISEDGCRLYFDRDFPGPETNSFVVERVPDLE